MPVKFKVVNPNDTTLSNNEVDVAVALKPAMELTLEANPAQISGVALGGVRYVEVLVTNDSALDYDHVALEFEDVQGYEVRAVTSPTYNPSTQSLVSNPDWEAPQWTGYGYRVKLRDGLQAGETKGYWARLKKREESSAPSVEFAGCGPCGDTGAYATVALGASEARITILPRGRTPEDFPLPDGGISIALYSTLNAGSEEGTNTLTPVDFVIDTQQVIPAGSWLRINNGYQVPQYEDIAFVLYPMDVSVTTVVVSPLLLEASFTTVLAAVPSGLIAPLADLDILIQFAMPVPVGRTVIHGTLYGYAEGRISARATASITADQAGATVLLSSTYVEGNGDRVNSAWILNDYQDYGVKRPANSEQGESLLVADNPGETYDCKVVLEVGTEIPPMSYLIVRNAEAGTSSNGGQHYSLALNLVGQPITLQYLGTIPAVGAQPCFESSSDAVYRLTDGVAEGVWTLAGSFEAATANYPDCSNALTVHVTSDPQGENRLAVFTNTATLFLQSPH